MKQFLIDFFLLLNREYNYAVLRTWESLPESVNSQDIDILIEKKELERFLKQLPEFLQKTNASVLYTFQDHQFFTIVFLAGDHHVLQVDFQFNFAWMGIDLLDERKVLKKRISNGKVWHLPPDYTFLPKYLYSRILGAKYPEKYAAVKAEAMKFNQSGIEAELKHISGRDFQFWENAGKWNLRLRTVFRALIHNPFRALSLFCSFILIYVRDLFFRRGLMISFTGPDGCGKSTVIDLLCERLSNNPPVLYHFRPGLFPNLGAAAKKAGVAKSVDTNFDRPHRAKRNGKLSSLIRLVYYSADYILGYYLKVLRVRQRKSIVIFDRYFTDIIADSERSSIFLDYRFLSFFRHFIPGCQYNFLFRVRPETILQRKRELTIDDMNTIYERLDYLSGKEKRCHWIDNNGTPEQAVDQILDALAEKRI